MTETDFDRNASAETAMIAVACITGRPVEVITATRPGWLACGYATYVVPPLVEGAESAPVLTLAHNGGNHFRAAFRGDQVVHIVSVAHNTLRNV